MLAVILAVVIPISIVGCICNMLYGTLYSKEYDPVPPWRWVAASWITALVSLWAVKKKSLDYSGSFAALIVGFVLTISNLCFCSCLLAFFISASKATNFRARRKKKFEENFKEGGQRNWVQVLCNGGIAAQFAIVYMIDTGCGEKTINFATNYNASWLILATLASLACSSGDTFASELGTSIGTSQPRLITNFKKVPRGTNGAISWAGTLSSLLGGCIVGVAFYITLVLVIPTQILEISPPQWPVIIYTSISGLLGSTIDSYMGAIFQYSGIDKKTGVIVERSRQGVKHISGWNLLDNHGVNLLASLITGFIAPSMGFIIWSHQTE